MAASDGAAPAKAIDIQRDALIGLHHIGCHEMEGFGLNDNEEILHREVVGDDLVKGYPVDPETGHNSH